jgi:RNA polymerase sigma factor (sigma-70 family)
VALQKSNDKSAEAAHRGNAADPQGSEALYNSHLHRFLIRRLHNRQDASDLAQEAYLRYLQLPDTGVVRNPSGYLFKIAFHLISEWRLRRDRSAVTFDSELADKRSTAWPDTAPDAFEQLTSNERLEQILAQIPQNYRRVLLMSKCDGLSNEQIAAQLHVTPETVVRYLARAVAFARKARWDEQPQGTNS